MEVTCLALALFQVITYIPPKASKYVGGTVTTIPDQARGELSASDESVLSFKWSKGGSSEGGEWRIPYKTVTYLGYGQHAGHRIGGSVAAAPATIITLAPVFVPLMVSKKRRHYVSLEYVDEQGKKHAAIFLVGKDAIRVLLKTLEVRTGKRVENEDEEAKKVGNK